jgi:hypothetical protein
MHPNAAYFIILLCLKPDNFTHQGRVLQWINEMHDVLDKELGHW